MPIPCADYTAILEHPPTGCQSLQQVIPALFYGYPDAAHNKMYAHAHKFSEKAT